MKISNQNALLSLMSQEYLEGIKTQIHSRIKSIAETSPENNYAVLNEDDEG